MRGELTGSYNRLERAAMGVVPVEAASAVSKRPTRDRRRAPVSANRRLLFGRVRTVTVLLLALAGMIWWTKDRHDFDWPSLLLPVATVFLVPAFVAFGSLTYSPRRPVPRLPWRGGDRVRAQDGPMTGGDR